MKKLLLIALFATLSVHAEETHKFFDSKSKKILMFNVDIILTTGEKVKFTKIPFFNGDGYMPYARVFALTYNGKHRYGLIDPNDCIICKPLYEEYYEFRSAKLHILCHNDKYTVYDFNGKSYAFTQDDIEFDSDNRRIITINSVGIRTVIPYLDP